MKSISKERWAELDLKTRIAYVTATVAFGLGWGLTIASFIVPPLGIVSDSVLWILGQSKMERQETDVFPYDSQALVPESCEYMETGRSSGLFKSAASSR